MVPCHLCGKDAVGGWIHGFVPSPDRLKVGLCTEHDTAAHRSVVKSAWRRLMEREVETLTACNEYRAGGPSLWRLRLTFIEGGMAEVTCVSCAPDERGALRSLLPDGTLRFYPLARIKSWEISPCPTTRECPSRQNTEVPPRPAAAPSSPSPSGTHPDERTAGSHHHE